MLWLCFYIASISILGSFAAAENQVLEIFSEPSGEKLKEAVLSLRRRLERIVHNAWSCTWLICSETIQRPVGDAESASELTPEQLEDRALSLPPNMINCRDLKYK